MGLKSLNRLRLLAVRVFGHYEFDVHKGPGTGAPPEFLDRLSDYRLKFGLCVRILVRISPSGMEQGRQNITVLA
jgi:hypothetical protein